MKQVVLTQEMKEKLAGCYLILEEECRIVRLGEPIELTPENFKAYWVDDDYVWQELTVDDFTWYNEDGSDKDYVYTEDDDYLYYDDAPDEVIELLDEVIEKRIQKEQAAEEAQEESKNK